MIFLPRLIILFAVLVAGCSKRQPNPQSFVAMNQKIGAVEVYPNPTTIDQERLTVLNSIKGTEQLQESIVRQLQAHNLWDIKSDFLMKVEITNFRLRHGATRFFTGAWSGSDAVEAQISLNKNGMPIMRSSVVASGGNGNPFNISRSSRGSGLFDGAGKLVLNALRKEPIASADISANKSPHLPVEPEIAAGVGASLSRKEIASARKEKCSLNQILDMKTLGLTDSQIKAACSDEIAPH